MATTHKPANRPDTADKCDVIVVGAGFAGLYMLHRLLKLGLNARVFEAGTDVGGTWFWNRYPGARCDVESLEYSYSFSEDLQQEWRWTERYATQPEILNYIGHVAERFDLKKHIQLETRITSAEFDEGADLWTVTSDKGDVVSAPYCIMATGCLSTAALPTVPGLESFRGKTYHTGLWPTDPVDFSGQRVGVVGTGSSAIQMIPHVAKQAAHLYVFQRTANYSLPARNTPLDPDYERAMKDRYAQVRQKARESPTGVAGFPVPDKALLDVSPQEREQTFQHRWDMGGISFTRAYNDVILSKEANAIAADFIRRKIRGLVHSPDVAELLTPS